MKVVEKDMMMRKEKVGERGARSEARQKLKRRRWCRMRPWVESQELCWRKSEEREEEKWLL